MDQAQGAIDAARAAGADRYATEQYEAAVKALENANAAVTQRDYRLALNYALESRDRAQTAAKEAGVQQGVLRSGAERRLGQVTAQLDQARRRLQAAEAAHVSRRLLTAPRAAIAGAEAYDLDGVAVVDGHPRPVLHSAKVRDAVSEFVSTPMVDGFDALAVRRADTADGRSATVTLAARWHPPVVSLFVPGGVEIEVTSNARSVFW